MPLVGFEHEIPRFEQAKIFRALSRTATPTGFLLKLNEIFRRSQGRAV
jgi:hypothetical protein